MPGGFALVQLSGRFGLIAALLLLSPVVRGEGAVTAPGQATPPAAHAATQAEVLAAFHALKADEIAQKKIETLPALEFHRIDVSSKVRSSSFGHKTTLLVGAGETVREFYVEYGRSTNRPAAHFGPFPLH